MTYFKNKVAVITGSSRGIGKAIAIELANKGAHIVLNGRDKQRLDKTKDELEALSAKVSAVCSDVSTIEGSNKLIDQAIKEFGCIDILVNNVGVSMRGHIADLNPEVYKMVFESNLLGTIYPTIPAIKYLRKTKGSIVFISSLAGIRGLPTLSAYSSSKMAIRAIAESLRIEEHKNNIHVGLIFVGITDIEHNKEAIAADGSKLILESRKNKKVSSPQYVAQKVLQNIRKRKFITVLTTIGKLNALLQPVLPMLVERLIIKNLKKFNEHSK
ncbi:MAG: SDR family oxidoreductase [Sphingobacteriaceae bacterium]|nr:SDR family oxidoreductase [Sphingobacteriaceae bacterium]